MARYLRPEQFGRYNFALSIIGVMAAVSGLGLHTIIVREVVRTPEKAGAILTASFIAMATVGTAGAGFFNLLPEKVVLAVDVSGGLVAIMSLMLIFKATDFVRSWFESQMQSRVTILAESALFVIAAAIRIYLLLNGAQLLAFVYLLVIEAAVLSALFIYVFVRFSGIRLTSAVSWRLPAIFSDPVSPHVGRRQHYALYADRSNYAGCDDRPDSGWHLCRRCSDKRIMVFRSDGNRRLNFAGYRFSSSK